MKELLSTGRYNTSGGLGSAQKGDSQEGVMDEVLSTSIYDITLVTNVPAFYIYMYITCI